MRRTESPRSSKTTYHRDGTVTIWNCLTQQWERGSIPSPALLSTMSEPERARVARHTGGDR